MWAADVAFVALYLLYAAGRLGDPLYLLGAERSYPEVFQHVKEFWMAGLLVWAAWLARDPRYLVWAAVFGYLLVDDVAQVHERAGRWAAVRWGFPGALGLRPIDFGELLVSAAAGGASLLALGAAYRSGATGFRAATRRLIGLVGLLAVCGVGFDMAHTAAGGRAEALFVTLEEGGEMVVVSGICGYAFHLLRSLRDPGPSDPAG